jgi:hypothetical protein
MLEPGTRISLGLAITILIVGIFSTAQFLLMPLIATYRANQQKILDTKDLLQRYRAMLDEEPIFLEQFAEQHDGVQTQAAYLVGPTTALAGAELQDRVRQALATVQSEVKSTEILSGIAADSRVPLDRIGLRVRFSTTTADLPTLLFDLESGEPYLFFDKLVIVKESNKNLVGDSENEAHLEVTFDVFGFLPKY